MSKAKKEKTRKTEYVLKPCAECSGKPSDHGCVTCPFCGYTDDIQCFDCLGADWDKVFCTQCHKEFQPACSNHAPECPQ